MKSFRLLRSLAPPPEGCRALCTALCVLGLMSGCASTLPGLPSANADVVFSPADKAENINYLDREALAIFEAPFDPVYTLSAGDHITVDVWGRPEVSGAHLIGPDGVITLPLAGPIKVSNASREEAADALATHLSRYYKRPAVVLRVDQYTGNRITVLGRVQNPGLISFDQQPSLLEALARAGALPVIDKEATLTRAAVFRGREKVAWVDLKHLLNRMDPSYNIRLMPGDLIYIPDSSDTMVYVMGAVHRPGAYRLTPDMSLLDALAQAGGPNQDGDPSKINIYRPGREGVALAPLSALVTDQPKANFSLEEGDIIYVDTRGIAKVGYVMRQLLPGLSFLTFGISTGSND